MSHVGCPQRGRERHRHTRTPARQNRTRHIDSAAARIRNPRTYFQRLFAVLRDEPLPNAQLSNSKLPQRLHNLCRAEFEAEGAEASLEGDLRSRGQFSGTAAMSMNTASQTWPSGSAKLLL